MVTALVTAVVVLSLLLILVLAVSIYRERRYNSIVTDLLDRVMARDYTQYHFTRTMEKAQPRKKRRYLTDPELAEIERQRGTEAALAAEREGVEA